MVRTLVLKFDARILILIGALLVMLAAWFPWTSLPSFVAGGLALRGVDGGGLLTFGLALLAALSLLLPWRPFRRVSLAAAILAALINLVALIAFVRVIRLSGIVGTSLGAQLGSVGSGLYLTFAGLVLMLFGSLSDAAPPSPFATQIIDMVSPRRMELALRLALVGLLIASCFCAWGVGLLMQPYTLVTPGQAQAGALKPVPTAYLATPLVDVQLAPLGTVAPAALNPPLPTLTPTRSNEVLSATPPFPPSVTVVPPSPTLHPSQPTALPTPTLAAQPTPGLPTIGAPTATPFPSPLNTPTVSATPSLTPTATITATATVTLTATATITP